MMRTLRLVMLSALILSSFGCSAGRVKQSHSYYAPPPVVATKRVSLGLVETSLQADKAGQGAVVKEKISCYVDTSFPGQQISVLERKFLLDGDFNVIESAERSVSTRGGLMSSSYSFPLAKRQMLLLKLILLTEFWSDGEKKLTVRNDFVADQLLNRTKP